MANGAGKSATFNIAKKTAETVERIFANLTTKDNLEMGE